MSDNAQKNKQIAGLKQRMGKAYGKFAKQGSHWHWIFTMADTQKRMDGYDKGYLDTSYETFERLKLRFFKGVLLNKHEKRNKFYSELVAGGNVFLRTNPDSEDNKEDVLIFSFNLQWQQDSNGKSYRHINFVLNTQVGIFSKGQINYLNELFGEYVLAIRNQYLPSAPKKANILTNFAASIPDKLGTQPQSPVPTPQPQTPPQHLFASLMAQVESLAPDFHTFLLACGFVFHKHEIINGKQMLTARLSNIIFVEVIENHALFADFEKLLRNVFGANCNLQYTVNAPQVQAQPKTPPQPEQIKQPTPLFASSDKRTGTTNSIGNLTAIPQTPKVQQQAPPTDQEKLSTAISKVAKFSENYAVQLHKFLEFNRIDQNILYLKCWSAQAIDKIQLHTLYENLCTALQATFEVEGVILETYKL